ncbi:MAG: substrate-binding domain-containing protein [Planctomycetes bacterium]|nr:substrate-binding domain-containing protein [Planctomycetota bacterium]MCB9870217.1 substrate-binding domain-containing protein [Planctomycetota bacterium]MCB9888203.1 substrate-binding domain-containing protein [Planctomycetota bacterium]
MKNRPNKPVTPVQATLAAFAIGLSSLLYVGLAPASASPPVPPGMDAPLEGPAEPIRAEIHSPVATVPAAPGPGGAGTSEPARGSVAPPAPRVRLDVFCSPTAHRLIGAALERGFERAHPNHDVVLHRAEDRACLDHLLLDDADVALVGCELSAREQGHGLQQQVVGHRILAPVIHLSNPVHSIRYEQLRDLVEGKVTSWQPLGWSDDSIEPVCLLGNTDDDAAAQWMQFQGKAANLAVCLRTPEEVLAHVSNHPFAIGLVPLAAAQGSTTVRGLEVDRVRPTRDQLERGAWRFGCTFRAVTRSHPDEAILAWLAYVQSNEARLVLRRSMTLPR